MSWREMVTKAMRKGTQVRFTEIVNRVAKLCEKEGYDYEPIQVKGSVARTLGNGLHTGFVSRPSRGIYVRS